MPSSNLIELDNTSQFVKLIEDPDQIVVLDFHAKWCGPCRKFGQFLYELDKEGKYPTVIFAKAETDKKVKYKTDDGSVEEETVFSDLTDKFNVKGIPRVLVFKGNTLHKDITGYNPTALVDALNKLVEA